VLFHSDDQAPERLSDPVLLAAIQTANPSVVTSDSGPTRRHYATVPVRSRNTMSPGSVVVSFDDEQIRGSLRSMLRSSVAMGLAAMAAGVLLLYSILSTFVTRPLADLIATVVKLRESPNDLARRARINAQDELGQLARAFNDLMQDLQSTTVSKSALQLALEQLRRTSDDLFEQKERAEVTLKAIADAVITVDAGGRVRYLNPVAQQLTGWDATSAIGRPAEEVVRLVDANSGDSLTPSGPPPPEQELDLLRRDGTSVGVSFRCAPMHGRDGQAAGRVLTFHDVSLERRALRRQTWEASHDVLTGLANRREFNDRLEAALVSAQHNGRSHVVCVMDLDRFKVINDSFGHAAGDELLKELATLMRSRVRESDTFARLGGDEFALLLEGCQLERARLIAADLVAAVRDYRYHHRGRSMSVGLSLGLATAEAGLTASEVLAMADTACYLAKEQGRDRVCVFSAGDNEMAARRRETGWVARIESALAQDRFVLYHQRYRALKAGAGAGAGAGARAHLEVLLRLVDEDGKLVMPGSFIPAAERYNLMPAIDRWVIRKVFAGYRSLLEEEGSATALTCAVNLSGTSLNSEGLIDFIREEARAARLPAGAICFEITETAAIHDLQAAERFMRECKALGFEFALDDFGIGSSSFGYLRRLPVDYLKIDGSFVRNIEHDPVDRAMTETINQVGHLLGIRTVAEYAENERIIELLRQIGVDYAQGYGVSRPRPLFAVPVEEQALLV
jgi:diguanylate cyclase (GGDEF)-like protein/PAS domain S-box-containing protein